MAGKLTLAAGRGGRRSIGSCVEPFKDLRLARIIFAGNAGNDPVARVYSKTTLGRVDIAVSVVTGSCSDSGMITVLEPLHGFHDDLLL
jgi:hypothetical protein